MAKQASWRGVGAGALASIMALAQGAVVSGCTGGGDAALSRERKVESPPEESVAGPCRVTGGGRIMAYGSPDSFGGNAQPFPRGGVDGEWNHVTHDGDHFHGDPASIECFNVAGAPAAPPAAPANAILFSGMGRFNDEEGCDFAVYIEDHGEPGTEDFYAIDVWCPSGVSYGAANTLLDGNLQIHAVPVGRVRR